jgi:hypothetical protein
VTRREAKQRLAGRGRLPPAHRPRTLFLPRPRPQKVDPALGPRQELALAVANPYAQPRRLSLLSSAPALVRPTAAASGAGGAALLPLPAGGRGEARLAVDVRRWGQLACGTGGRGAAAAAGPVFVAVRDDDRGTVEECWAVALRPAAGGGWPGL